MAEKESTCVYMKCLLPKNNHRYLWQIAYSFFAIVMLMVNTNAFTFVAVFLLVVPILTDAFFSEFHTRRWRWCCRIFIVVDIIVAGLCFLGLIGVLIDKGQSIAITTTFMYFGGKCVEKKYVAWILFANVVIPFILFIGSPCQSTKNLAEKIAADVKRVKEPTQ